NVPDGLALQAKLYPVDGPATSPIALAPVTGGYHGAFDLAEPALAAYLQIWVDEPEPRREAIADYALGGNPGHVRPRGTPRDSPGHVRPRGAPGVSSDGQVIVFGDDLIFAPGSFFTLQAIAALPSPPAWATVVGQGYRLASSADAPNLSGASINIGYLGKDVS